MVDSPLKQEEVEVVVALCQEVSQNSCGIARSNLIGRQTEVNAFHKVPELSHQVLIKAPADGQVGQRHRSDRQVTLSSTILSFRIQMTNLTLTTSSVKPTRSKPFFVPWLSALSALSVT